MPVLEAAGDRPFPIISLVGGKWTTFRAFGQEVADWVQQVQGHDARCRPPVFGYGAYDYASAAV